MLWLTNATSESHADPEKLLSHRLSRAVQFHPMPAVRLVIVLAAGCIWLHHSCLDGFVVGLKFEVQDAMGRLAASSAQAESVQPSAAALQIRSCSFACKMRPKGKACSASHATLGLLGTSDRKRGQPRPAAVFACLVHGA